MRWSSPMALLGGLCLTAGAMANPSNIDPTLRWSWAENVGWFNWRHSRPAGGDGIFISPRILSGYVWAENVGWIHLGDGDPGAVGGSQLYYANADGADYGVNIDPETGELEGYGWGENIGWVNFAGGGLATPPNPARLDGCRLRGYAWGENIGWINLDDATRLIEVETSALAGDLNCDCAVNFNDIDAFVAALVGPGAYQAAFGACDIRLADTNCDGAVDFDDIDSFVTCLVSGRCPRCTE